MSVSFAVASMVMFPDEVDKVTAASPSVMSSAAEDTPLVKYVLKLQRSQKPSHPNVC